MAVPLSWPLKWNDSTERLLCERLGAALRAAKMDPTLIRGQFDVKGLRLGGIAPHIELLEISKARVERVGLDVLFRYRDTCEGGLSITIGGAEISLTGMEADDTSFGPTKLWYPFEVTLFNIQVDTKVTLEYALKRPPRQRHAPPPVHALHELHVGRQRGQPLRFRPDALLGAETPPFFAHPNPSSRSLLGATFASTAASEALRCEAPANPSSIGGAKSRADSLGLWTHGGGAKAKTQHHNIGFAYAARRIHYPRWGGRGAGPPMYPPHAAAGVEYPSLPPTPNVAPSTSSLVSPTVREVPSTLSLDRESFASHASSPSNSTLGGRRARAAPPGGPPPADALRALLPSDSPTLQIVFARVPDIDFAMKTNFRTLKGADEQVTNVVKSVLKPKLADLLRGIIVRLDEGSVALGPEGADAPPPAAAAPASE
eukprot:TRINITY_DN19666_c0_g1_i1.p1 TRINITY_DN19666_c0_g1~~TRINITY_DN19666_c0_g1_i1.p1  ORF type:complete len:429 (+),score=118.17 TRINITY_DN19666_c0_g1_i1:63-1349(+)